MSILHSIPKSRSACHGSDRSNSTSRPTSTGGEKRQGGSPRGVTGIAKLPGGSKTIRSLDDTYQIGFPGAIHIRIHIHPDRDSNHCSVGRATARSRKDRISKVSLPACMVHIPCDSRRMDGQTGFRSRAGETDPVHIAGILSGLLREAGTMTCTCQKASKNDGIRCLQSLVLRDPDSIVSERTR